MVSINERICKVDTYDGSMRSLNRIVKQFGLREGEAHLCIVSKKLTIYRHGIVLKPGSNYVYMVRSKFKAI